MFQLIISTCLCFVIIAKAAVIDKGPFAYKQNAAANERAYGGQAMDKTPIDPAWADFDASSRCGQLLVQFARPVGLAMVGHFTHSLTVRDLRRYFDPNATAVNYVPTINRNTKSDKPLLLHAPAFPELDGDTEALKTLDLELSHMDDKNWDAEGYTTLERIAHAFHMEEAWSHAKAYYDDLRRSPTPPSPELCACMMDVEKNGILKYLRFTALEIREPQLVYGRQLVDFGPNAMRKDYYSIYYKSGRRKRSVDSGDQAQMHQGGMKSGSGPSHLLADDNKGAVHLTDAAAWKEWKKVDKSPDMDYNNALFIFCAVEKAHSH